MIKMTIPVQTTHPALVDLVMAYSSATVTEAQVRDAVVQDTLKGKQVSSSVMLNSIKQKHVVLTWQALVADLKTAHTTREVKQVLAEWLTTSVAQVQARVSMVQATRVEQLVCAVEVEARQLVQEKVEVCLAALRHG